MVTIGAVRPEIRHLLARENKVLRIAGDEDPIRLDLPHCGQRRRMVHRADGIVAGIHDLQARSSRPPVFIRSAISFGNTSSRPRIAIFCKVRLWQT